MKKQSSQNRIIWAIDPLLNSTRKLSNAKKLIHAWRQQNAAVVSPVSIVTPDDFHLPAALMAPWGTKLQELTEKSIAPFLNKLLLKNMSEPDVITSSKKDSIDDFLTHIKSKKAQVIMTTTHDRGSHDKNRIGKFTQKLIERSDVPVLTIRPSSKVPQKINKILYPTDFSPGSKESYIKLIKIAKFLKSKICIFHNIYEPVLPAAELTGVTIEKYDILKSYVIEYFHNQKMNAEKWIEMAKKEGVKAEFNAVRAEFSLGQSILSAAQKEKVQMIALGIESHPILRAILKSSTREVISMSPQPVLVINSQSEQKNIRKKGGSIWKDPNSLLV